MKFAIKHHYADAVLFEADIPDDTESGLQMRVALEKATAAGAYLGGAYLDGANLAGANLDGAYLAGAYLARAYLAGANLAGATMPTTRAEQVNAPGWAAEHPPPAPPPRGPPLLLRALRSGPPPARGDDRRVRGAGHRLARAGPARAAGAEGAAPPPHRGGAAAPARPPLRRRLDPDCGPGAARPRGAGAGRGGALVSRQSRIRRTRRRHLERIGELRPVGCESPNHPHDHCWGSLWTCAGCGRRVCWADGCADDAPELCDTCWASSHQEAA